MNFEPWPGDSVYAPTCTYPGSETQKDPGKSWLRLFPWYGQSFSILITLPPLSVVFFKPV